MNRKALEKKYIIERNFHDNWAKSIKYEEVNFKAAFEAITALENKFALSLIDNLKKKTVLDLGCGMGDASLYFAYQGARVNAIDISPEMIKLVNKLAKKNKLSNTIYAEVMVAEKLNFKNNFFDFIFGNGILHHAEPELTLKEVFRVLKPNGIAAFIEPLDHNPLISIYRKLASKVRTPTERPLKYNQLDYLTTAKFRSRFHKEFHLITLLIFVWYFLVSRVSPNNERYWKKIINEADQIASYFKVLNIIDRAILTMLPFMRRYCWNTVLVYKK